MLLEKESFWKYRIWLFLIILGIIHNLKQAFGIQRDDSVTWWLKALTALAED